MESASYYREQADRARRIASIIHQPDAIKLLRQFAEDYDSVAEDLENGAVEVRHPELLPQNRARREPSHE